MPRLEFEGKTFDLPDDLSQGEISRILLGRAEQADVRKAEGSQPGEFPVASAAEQAARDKVAAKIRLGEVGGDMKEVQKAVAEIKAGLKIPMNSSVRQMLKRELAHWEALLEKKSED